MAKMYDNQKTHTTTITGTISSISENRCDYTVKTQKYNRDTKENEDKELKIVGEEPLAADVSVGQTVTVLGEHSVRKGGYAALFATTKDGSFDLDSICVIRGEVVFANYNEEKDQNGNANMSRPYTKADGSVVEPHAKKPHFDIGVVTNDPDPASTTGETRRVLHTIRVYAGNDPKPLERIQSAFKNFSKDNAPTVSLITAPGQPYTTEKEGSNGQKFTNTYVNHMGYRFMDIEWGKERTKETAAASKEAKEEKAPFAEAPAKDAAEPEQTGNGFEAPAEAQEISEAVDDMFI